MEAPSTALPDESRTVTVTGAVPPEATADGTVAEARMTPGGAGSSRIRDQKIQTSPPMSVRKLDGSMRSCRNANTFVRKYKTLYTASCKTEPWAHFQSWTACVPTAPVASSMMSSNDEFL